MGRVPVGMKVLSAPIDAELHKQVRIRAVEEGITVQELVIRATTTYLAEHRAPG